MKNKKQLSLGLLLSVMILSQGMILAQNTGEDALPIKFEELTSSDFIKAVELSGGTCIIPLGIMEKHGAHLPLGTDLYIARDLAMRAAGEEYTVVFPEYYVGQIFEAKHQPGTISYSDETIWNLLDETCMELARNGMKKIILVNGHGGNTLFLQYFCQAQLEKKKDYCVILFSPDRRIIMPEVNKLRKNPAGGHAGDMETGMMLNIRPDLFHKERVGEQSGENLDRLKDVPYAYTGIWWYARYPNHYAGDASIPSTEAGELMLSMQASQLIELIRILKENNDILDLQNLFFKDSKNPLNTEQ